MISIRKLRRLVLGVLVVYMGSVAVVQAVKMIDDEMIRDLITQLKDGGCGQASAVSILSRIGSPAVEPLIAALKDEDNNIRSGAILALGRIGDSRAVEPLKEVAQNDNNFDVRRIAQEALGKLKQGTQGENNLVHTSIYDAIRGNVITIFLYRDCYHRCWMVLED